MAGPRRQCVFTSTREAEAAGIARQAESDGGNRPEERRRLIEDALREAGAVVIHVRAEGGMDVWDACLQCGVATTEKLDLLREGFRLFAEASGFSDPGLLRFRPEEPGNRHRLGVVPHYFVRAPAAAASHIERRLAWHATDDTTPLLRNLRCTLEDDLAVCLRAVASVCQGAVEAAYALTTHAGHHASRDHYGGYCFLNLAALASRWAQLHFAKRSFVIDVDYHAGDGTAQLMADGDFVSLHVANDYPNVPADVPWACPVPAGCEWDDYESILRTSLRKVPADCGLLILSLGYDTLAGDPVVVDGAALRPRDFQRMRAVLDECGLPLLVIQEGGYNLADIPEAAVAFWAAADAPAALCRL